MITWNNPFGTSDTQPIRLAVSDKFDDILNHEQFRFLAGQYEKGEEGTLHLQMYVEFIKAIYITEVHKLVLGADVRVCHGTQVECLAYVVKEDTRQCGPWTWGKPGKQGERTDIIAYTDAIKEGASDDDLLSEYPQAVCRYYHHIQVVRSIMYRVKAYEMYEAGIMRRCTILVGDTGGGKTRYIYDTYGLDDVYQLSFGTGTASSVWFDMYHGESILLLDDFYGQLRHSFLLRLCDRIPIRVQVKGGSTFLQIKRIYITSNTQPTEWYQTVPERARLAFERRIEMIFKVPEDMEKLKLYDSARI